MTKYDARIIIPGVQHKDQARRKSPRPQGESLLLHTYLPSEALHVPVKLLISTCLALSKHRGLAVEGQLVGLTGDSALSSQMDAEYEGCSQEGSRWKEVYDGPGS